MIDTLKGSVKSKTIWFNGVIAALVAAGPDLIQIVPMLEGIVPTGVYGKLVIAVAIANIFLRKKTTMPLSEK